MTETVSWVGLATSGALVAVAVAISLGRGLGLERSILWACARALVQLLAVGAVLALLLDEERSVWWSWGWVAAMIAFAAHTTGRRAKEVPGATGLAAVAFTIATAVTMGVLLGLGIFPATSRTIVPLAGMVIGNSLAATVLVGRRIIAELTERRDEVEARLALGHTSRQAAQPYLRTAVRTALIPQIETTKATGIIFLPGAMVGLILAGAEPAQAVKVQVAVMYLILGSVATTTAIVAIGLGRRLFTADHRLVRLVRPEA